MRISSRKAKGQYVQRRNKKAENSRMQAYVEAFKKLEQQKRKEISKYGYVEL